MAWLTALFGFFTPFLPEVIKYFNKKQDYAQELKMMEVRNQQAEKEYTWRMAEVEAKADIEESKALRVDTQTFGHDILDSAAKTGWPTFVVAPLAYIYAFLDVANQIIRPWITFAIVSFYMLVKYGQYKMLVAQSVLAEKAISQIWTENDYAILALVLSFWFGQRAAKYAFKWK